MKDLRAIILAAGKGTRMKSETPKVLHLICGKPILQYIFDIIQSIGSLKTCVVLGHKNHLVKNYLGKNVASVIQRKLLGTADAVRCARPALRNYHGQVVILCGDTPLLKKETVRALIAKHKRLDADCTFLTAVVENPAGYGRIIRGEERKAMAIREEKDASEYEKNIAEINVGVYCFKSGSLLWVGEKVMLRIDLPHLPGATYPDGGSSAEVYTNPDPLQYVELEMLGAIDQLKPGDYMEFPNTYTLLRRSGADAKADALRVFTR